MAAQKGAAIKLYHPYFITIISTRLLGIKWDTVLVRHRTGNSFWTESAAAGGGEGKGTTKNKGDLATLPFYKTCLLPLSLPPLQRGTKINEIDDDFLSSSRVASKLKATSTNTYIIIIIFYLLILNCDFMSCQNFQERQRPGKYTIELRYIFF